MAKKGLNPSHIARALVPAIALGVLSTDAIAQEAPEICMQATVERGDTLRKIARRTYERDERDDWKLIYDRNRDQIGRSPDLIEVGMVLQVPCLPGQTASAATDAPIVDQDDTIVEAAASVETQPPAPAVPVVSVQTSVTAPSLPLDGNFQPAPAATPAPEPVAEPVVIVAATPEPEPEPQPAPQPVAEPAIAETQRDPEPQPASDPIEPVMVAEADIGEDDAAFTLVTGNGYAPFTDEALPGRGFFTLLVQTAMLRADPDSPYKIKFVNDWDAHLDALMPSLAFDASFPWAEPDCSQMAQLSPAEQSRCLTYKFSDPFYEVVDGFFARKGSGFEEAATYAEFAGAVICRPEGYTTSHLDLAGLKEPLVRYVRPVEVSACFEMLMRADVDLVSIETQVADDTIAKMGLPDSFALNPNLAAVRPLTVIVHTKNPNGDAFLDILNEGLRIMRDSGEWYAITSRALMQQAEAES